MLQLQHSSLIKPVEKRRYTVSRIVFKTVALNQAVLFTTLQNFTRFHSLHL